MTERTLRETVAQAIYNKLEGPVANQDFVRQTRQWGLSLSLADAALDAHTAAQPAPDAVAEAWQTMDTAPTDGTKFVATNGRLTFTTYTLKYYEKFPHEEGGPIYKSRWTAEDGSSVWPWNPTSWTPLPLAKGTRP